jgi:DNA sulfur modification protein DndC
MKIDPTTEYIRRVVQEQGEVIILLGARKAESATRAQALANRAIEGSRLKRHSTLPRCLVYTPIEDWDTQEVWVYLFQVPSPWGGDNKELFRLYSRADGGECPLVIDSSTPSCGNSRFGCWVCTVVEHDRAVEGFIESGDERLEPLLAFRNFLKEARSSREWRERIRKNGQLLNQKGEEVWGPFTLAARKAILRRLLVTEEQAGLRLISPDELTLIQKIWREGDRSYDGPQADTSFSVSSIMREIRGKGNMSTVFQLLENADGEDKLLAEICQRHGIRTDIVERLRAAEEKVSHLQRRDGIFNDIEDIFDQALPASGNATSKPHGATRGT